MHLIYLNTAARDHSDFSGVGKNISSSVIRTTGSNRFRCPPVQPVRRSPRPRAFSAGGEAPSRRSASRALQSSSSTSTDPMTAVAAKVIWISLWRC
ncbi:hypothetical protein NL676_003522 [Syzygium grande]|nr:hypothetical protein NL676_003522 [Syzygium grande]